MEITVERLKEKFNQMSLVGRNSNGGISRVTLTEYDVKARNLLVEWFKDLDLKVRIDDVGNVYGRREGYDPNAEPIVFGSHLDSIDDGGLFDGILGILAGIEIIETLTDHSLHLKNPIEVVNFTNEEGVRFKSLMSGSGILSGDYKIENVYAEKDTDGNTFYDELIKSGYLGSKENRLKNAKAFLELHIEQGRILDTEKVPVGVVEGMLGFKWFNVRVKGTSSPAGPTPMKYRRDPFKAAVKMIEQFELLILKSGGHASFTVGNLEIEPGYINTVPGDVNFTMDVREQDVEKLTSVINQMEKVMEETAVSEKVEIEIKEIKYFPPMNFSGEICNTIEEESNKLNYKSIRMISGAGHISTFMNNFVPTAMLFVPSINGVSHSPQERTSWEDIEKATNVLLRTTLSLSEYKIDSSMRDKSNAVG